MLWSKKSTIQRDKEKEIDALKDQDQVYLVLFHDIIVVSVFFFFCFKNNSLILNFSILFGVFFSRSSILKPKLKTLNSLVVCCLLFVVVVFVVLVIVICLCQELLHCRIIISLLSLLLLLSIEVLLRHKLFGFFCFTKYSLSFLFLILYSLSLIKSLSIFYYINFLLFFVFISYIFQLLCPHCPHFFHSYYLKFSLFTIYIYIHLQIIKHQLPTISLFFLSRLTRFIKNNSLNQSH